MHRTILLGAIVALLTAAAITLSSKLPRLAAALETIDPAIVSSPPATAPGRPSAALSGVQRLPVALVRRGIGCLLCSARRQPLGQLGGAECITRPRV